VDGPEDPAARHLRQQRRRHGRLGAQYPDNGLVEHWDGRSWSVVTLPVSSSASVLLDGIAVGSDGTVWVAGEADSPQGGRPLIEYYQAGVWQVAALPASAGSVWTNLYAITVVGSTVWAVGTYVDPATNNNNALVLSGQDGAFNVDPAPDPGSGSNILGGLTAIDGQLWAAGVYDNGGGEIPFVEHR